MEKDFASDNKRITTAAAEINTSRETGNGAALSPPAFSLGSGNQSIQMASDSRSARAEGSSSNLDEEKKKNNSAESPDIGSLSQEVMNASEQKMSNRKDDSKDKWW